jgi:hypothetical protein
MIQERTGIEERTHYQRRYNHIYGVKAAETLLNDQV